ncbi:MAG TPA: DUF4390 domain-containing protein [Longimicrobiaceae bacterium]
MIALHRAGRVLFGLALALLCLTSYAAAQATARLQIRQAPPEQGYVPVIDAVGLLRDPALRRALESGLPLRFRLRVELWENRFFDRLAGEQEVAFALTQDPLDRTYSLTAPNGERHFATLSQAEAAVGAQLRVNLRPPRRGRFYYLARLEVETLSLSDLEELRRWLQGDVGPAVEGRASPESAVESGLRRLLVRVIGLPTRRLEARSGTFTVR